MRRHMRRRRHRAHRGEKTVTGRVMPVLFVICFSVLAGYITANYMIGPMLGLESEPVFSDFIKNKKEDSAPETKNNNETKVVQDSVNMQSESGYALQYGSFSTKEGAEQFAAELAADGTETRIIEKDQSYKVIGKVFETKQEARNYKESTSAGKDIFITEIP